MLRRIAVLVLASSLGLAVACEDEEPRPAPASDIPVQPGGPPGGGGGGGEGGASDAAAEGSEAGATCHALTVTGPVVDLFAVVSEPPAGAGGAVADGEYDLTEARIYGVAGGGATDVTLQGALRVDSTSSTMDRVLVRQAAGVPQESRVTLAYATSGANLTTSITCPAGGGQEQATYTATGTTLVITNVVTRESYVFTRR